MNSITNANQSQNKLHKIDVLATKTHSSHNKPVLAIHDYDDAEFEHVHVFGVEVT
ncbi:hypothetical protein PRZ48_008852 [Zasmidium cellare]|uniref:Uncharacterized protein n=1 Tax=Zasmidium cellare TaxID=395010 RepID=A0ABR0EHW4_ZASCE|nr:hypothetical protein PRZ48_008852 [Zasmidium cellare]